MFKKLFQLDQKNQNKEEVCALRNIIDKLEHLPDDKATFLACFAYILGRVAHADFDISEEETDKMEKILLKLGNLEKAEAILVVEIAKHQNKLFGGTENYVVTRQFNDLATNEQKFFLMDCLFAVAASDDNICTLEGRELRMIADQLRIPPSEYAQIRSKFADKLAVLK